MTETAQGQTTTAPRTPVYSSGSSYYPRTTSNFGLEWNDGEITTIYTRKELIKIFVNAIKLKRIGVFTADHYIKRLVFRTVVENGVKQEDKEVGEWVDFKPARDDVLELYRVG